MSERSELIDCVPVPPDGAERARRAGDRRRKWRRTAATVCTGSIVLVVAVSTARARTAATDIATFGPRTSPTPGTGEAERSGAACLPPPIDLTGTTDPQTDDELDSINDPEALVGLADGDRIVGYFRQNDLQSDTPLVRLIDQCGNPTGWMSVDGRFFLTDDEVKTPGFDLDAAIAERRAAQDPSPPSVPTNAGEAAARERAATHPDRYEVLNNKTGELAGWVNSADDGPGGPLVFPVYATEQGVDIVGYIVRSYGWVSIEEHNDAAFDPQALSDSTRSAAAPRS